VGGEVAKVKDRNDVSRTSATPLAAHSAWIASIPHPGKRQKIDQMDERIAVATQLTFLKVSHFLFNA
jgi:hypothetical protein